MPTRPLQSGSPVRKHNGRKKHNQYFTPRQVVRFALSLVPTRKVSTIIDPAMGDGAFLLEAGKVWPEASVFGVDIDPDIVAHMRRRVPPKFHLFTGDSLRRSTFANGAFRPILDAGGFDLVLGNPPFSSWFQRVAAYETLACYHLARRSKGALMPSQAIEVLFLEQFIRLAKPHGWVAIVLPDGVLGNARYQTVRDFIFQHASIRFIISLSRGAFAGTSAKTSLVILHKGAPPRRGIARLVEVSTAGTVLEEMRLPEERLRERMDFEYHHRANDCEALSLQMKRKFSPLAKYCTYFQTGRTLYGEKRGFSQRGLRFLHATNIRDIGIDYGRDLRYIEPGSPMDSPKAHARPGDILFVRVGVGCAGRAAVVVDDEDVGVASDYIHIIRVQGVDPYFLVAYLKTPFAKKAIDLRKHGVATVSLNKSDVLSLPIPDVARHFQSTIGQQYRALLLDWRADPMRNELQAHYASKMQAILDAIEAYLTRHKGAEARVNA